MKKILLLAWLILGMVSLYGAGDLRIFSVQNADGKMNATVVEKALEANGFVISSNTEMNGPFVKQFGKSDFTQFNLLTAFHKVLSDSLVRSHPDAGIFLPMGFGIYQRNGDKNFYVSVLTAEAMKKIAGFDAPEFALIEKEVLATIKKALPGAKMVMSEPALPAQGPLLTRYVKPTDAASWAADKDSTEMMIEEGLKPAGFVLSNFTDYNFVLNEGTVPSPFDFYDTYSICKLKVINTVANTRPEAGTFAPCSLMVYKVKGSNEIVMGFPSVYNWISSAHITDPDGKAALLTAQKDFEEVLKSATE
ncbi:MAG: DUF302 domain-containing protein [Sulfuricurvum sp.]|nr:DUF302 domain-containing protein [Sulfuricurvum sp.]